MVIVMVMERLQWAHAECAGEYARRYTFMLYTSYFKLYTSSESCCSGASGSSSAAGASLAHAAAAAATVQPPPPMAVAKGAASCLE